MRNSLLLIFLTAALGLGCNSKTNQVREDAPEQIVEETKVPAGSADQRAFRDRLAVQPTLTNAQAATVAQVRQRVPFRPPTPQNRASETAGIPADASADAEVSPEAEKIRPEDIPEEGDEILIPPKLLGALIPGANFENIAREEPINIRDLLDQQGIVLTNYQQLIDLGITNYTIARAPKLPPEKVPE